MRITPASITDNLGVFLSAFLRVVVLFVVSFFILLGLALLGMHFYFEPKNVETFWPASGVLFAALFTTRFRLWIPIGLSYIAAAVVSDLILSDRLSVLSAVFGFAGLIEASVGALLLRQYLGSKIEFSRLRHVIAFVVFAAIVSTSLCALVGAAGLVVAYPTVSYWSVFQVWWFADAIGVLLTAPAVLAWITVAKERANPFSRKCRLETVLLFGLLLLTAQSVFGAEPGPMRFVLDHPYVIFPLLLWAAVRLEPPIVTLSLLVIGVLVVEYTDLGRGPFVGNSRTVEELVLSVQAFMTITALSTLGLLAITGERKRIVGALESSQHASGEKQAQLDNLLANVDAIVLEGDPLDIYYVGGQVEKILGYPREMWFEHPEGPVGFWAGLLHPDDLDKMEICRQAIERGEDHAFEYRMIAKDGRPKWFYDSVTVECFEGKPVKTRSVMIDITDRKHAEEESRQHQEKMAHVARLSTMGEMATGLAHELNQPLAAMAAYCFAGEQVLADSESEDADELRELFKKSADQATRAGEIIRRLRGLVGKRAPVRERVDIGEPIREVLHLLESDLRESEIRVEQQMDHSDEVVTIDEIQIQQVLVNLVRNAREAMSETEGEKRTLKISTSRTADDLIEVAVSDSGMGVPGKSAGQVFDAFFSTKSEGMGMGLAISRSIVESHHGRLWMTPNPDRGVTFHLTLPVAREGSDGNGR
jgi:PAS domain S-box-containing protein